MAGISLLLKMWSKMEGPPDIGLGSKVLRTRWWFLILGRKSLSMSVSAMKG